jgi:hypothetical protein
MHCKRRAPITVCSDLLPRIVGLPECCPCCHHRGQLLHVEVDGVPMALCCEVVSALSVRWAGSVVSTDQLPVNLLASLRASVLTAR